jgi:hypothetical protein
VGGEGAEEDGMSEVEIVIEGPYRDGVWFASHAPAFTATLREEDTASVGAACPLRAIVGMLEALIEEGQLER